MTAKQLKMTLGFAVLGIVLACLTLIAISQTTKKAPPPDDSTPSRYVMGTDPTIRLPGEPTKAPPQGPKPEFLQAARAQHLSRAMDELHDLLDLTPEQRKAVEAAFHDEEAAWRSIWDAWVERSNKEGIKDGATFFDPPYSETIEGITARTDAKIKNILTESHYRVFSEWRRTYNRGRFFWHEED